VLVAVVTGLVAKGELAEAGTGSKTRDGVAKPVAIRMAESCHSRPGRRPEIPSRFRPLSADGDVGASDPGAMSLRGWDREEPSVLDAGQLPAALMDQPVVAVAEQDQVVDRGLPYAPRDLPRLGRAQAIPDGCRVLGLVSWTRKARARKPTDDAVLVRVCSLGFPKGRLVCGTGTPSAICMRTRSDTARRS
jgi:hypothetical protein